MQYYTSKYTPVLNIYEFLAQLVHKWIKLPHLKLWSPIMSCGMQWRLKGLTQQVMPTSLKAARTNNWIVLHINYWEPHLNINELTFFLNCSICQDVNLHLLSSAYQVDMAKLQHIPADIRKLNGLSGLSDLLTCPPAWSLFPEHKTFSTSKEPPLNHAEPQWL